MKNLIQLLVLVVVVIGCKSPEARQPVTHTSGSFIKASAQRNIKLNETQHAQILNIIDTNTDIEYIASENGFWYYYNTKIEGDSIKAQFGDIVNYNYNVKDLNGSTIYSEAETKTQEYAMDQAELFSGLREGLKLMYAGETATFIFPSQKAYGYYGDEHKIGTNVPIICKVTINSITQKENN